MLGDQARSVFIISCHAATGGDCAGEFSRTGRARSPQICNDEIPRVPDFIHHTRGVSRNCESQCDRLTCSTRIRNLANKSSPLFSMGGAPVLTYLRTYFEEFMDVSKADHRLGTTASETCKLE